MTELGRLMLEETWEKAMTEGRKEGRKEGQQQGMDRLNQLNQNLARQNRTDDIIRAAEDRAYQEKLLREFRL